MRESRSAVVLRSRSSPACADARNAADGARPSAHRSGALRATASLEDVYPTLLQAAGVDPRPTPARSLWPVLNGADPPARAHYAFLPQRGFSTRFAKWARPEHGQAALIDPESGHKVILRLRSETWEAYDLHRDPGERDNLAGDGLAWADSMLAALREEIAQRSR